MSNNKKREQFTVYRIAISLALIFSLGGCYSWEGVTFSKRIEYFSNQRIKQTQTKLENNSCIQTYREEFAGRVVSSTQESLEADQCAPFIIAEKIVDRFGKCSPKQILIEKRRYRSRSGSGIIRYISKERILNENCLCVDQTVKETVRSHGLPDNSPRMESKAVYLEFGKVQNCAKFFDEEKHKEILKIIEEVMQRYKEES